MTQQFTIYRGNGVHIKGRFKTDPLAWLKAEAVLPELDKFKQNLVQRWKRIAAEKIKNPEMLAKFQAAMAVESEVKPTGTLIRFVLHGMWGAALESGWAPVGTTFMAGVGKYDGAAHDMRPLLMATNTYGPSENTGRRYKFIRISHSISAKRPAFAKESPLQFVTRRMGDAVTGFDRKNPRRKFFAQKNDAGSPTVQRRRREAIRARLEAGAAFKAVPVYQPRNNDPNASPQERYDSVIRNNTSLREGKKLGVSKDIAKTPARKMMSVGAAVAHQMSMLKGAIITKPDALRKPTMGNMMSVVRTVTDDSSKGDWFSEGFPPAHTFQDITDAAIVAFREMWRPKGRR